MKTCVITCTGKRWELFRLCQRWVEHQTRKPDVWIVTTDTGEVPSDLPDYAEFLAVDRVMPRKGCQAAEGALACAIQNVPDDHNVVVMEDDDWYGENYVEQMSTALTYSEVAQVDRGYRYHLPSRRWSRGHPSKPGAPIVPGVVAWRASMSEQIANAMGQLRKATFDIGFVETSQTLSIKGVGHGLPGRAGATSKHEAAHRKNKQANLDSEDYRFLRDFMGNDAAEAYISLLET